MVTMDSSRTADMWAGLLYGAVPLVFEAYTCYVLATMWWNEPRGQFSGSPDVRDFTVLATIAVAIPLLTILFAVATQHRGVAVTQVVVLLLVCSLVVASAPRTPATNDSADLAPVSRGGVRWER